MSVKTRIKRLEKKARNENAVIIWRESDETAENALERHYREHPEHMEERKYTVHIIGWVNE